MLIMKVLHCQVALPMNSQQINLKSVRTPILFQRSTNWLHAETQAREYPPCYKCNSRTETLLPIVTFSEISRQSLHRITKVQGLPEAYSSCQMLMPMVFHM